MSAPLTGATFTGPQLIMEEIFFRSQVNEFSVTRPLPAPAS